MKRKTLLKKTVSVTVAGAAALTMLGGCGSNSDNTKTADGKTKITIYGWADKNASPEGYELEEAKKAKFMEMNPDIDVQGDPYTFAIDSFAPKAEGGTLPTLYNTFLTEIKNIGKMGYAKPITQLLKDNGYYDMYNDSLIDMVSYEGEIYGALKNVYTMGLIVNLDLFEKAGLMNADGSPMVPDTFDDVEKFAKIIKEKTGVAGFVQATTNNVGGWTFMPLAWSYGTEFMKESNGKWEATFDSPECKAALEYLKKLKWEDGVMPAETLLDANGVIRVLSTNQAAMAILHPDSIILLKTNGMDINNIGMFKIPAGPVRRVTLMGGGVEVVAANATDDQASACLKWMAFGGYSPNLTDEQKANIEEDYKLRVSNGELIGVKDLSIWNDKSDTEKYTNEMIDKYCNINPLHVASYNDKSGVEYRAEEPKNAQELYATLDRCIQEILNNKDADCGEVLKKAAEDFQKDYFNN